MPPDPSYIDPFYKPRKPSRLERLRYRVSYRVLRHFMSVRTEGGGITGGVTPETRNARLFLIALVMAGCGAVAGAWVVFGWGGG